MPIKQIGAMRIMPRRTCEAAVALLLCSSLSIYCGGCGLVFIPTVHSYPDPVNSIEVRDAATGDLLAEGGVRCLLIRDEYKGYPWDRPGVWTSAAPAKFPVNPDGSILPVHRLDNGRFAPEHAILLGLWQWLWPWAWATYGDFQHYGARTSIIALAPDHAGLCIEYRAGARPDDLRLIRSYESPGECRLSGDGVLVFLLRRNQPPPADDVDGLLEPEDR